MSLCKLQPQLARMKVVETIWQCTFLLLACNVRNAINYVEISIEVISSNISTLECVYIPSTHTPIWQGIPILCPNPQITRATHCPVIECVCVCVCVCVRSHARNQFSVKYDVLIDQVR